MPFTDPQVRALRYLAKANGSWVMPHPSMLPAIRTLETHYPEYVGFKTSANVKGGFYTAWAITPEGLRVYKDASLWPS
jgi:hypothetical protein